MKIQELRLATAALDQQHAFYANVLGLETLEQTPTRVSFRVGASQLVFEQSDRSLAGVYHFAFNIPVNQLEAALDWTSDRVPLLASATGQTVFHSESWNADMFYFADPAGNILEFIARHTLRDSSDMPFDTRSLLNVSEIGIAAEDVPAEVAKLTAQIGDGVYKEGDPTFTPVGDEHGLLIVVQRGRIWFPNTGKPAQHLPIRARVQGQHGLVHLAFAS